MIWQIVNNVDNESANKIPLHKRSPFIEYAGLMDKDIFEDIRANGSPEQILDFEGIQNIIDSVANSSSPRVIKTHLPFEFLPPNLLETCKVVFVSRNPKDVCVSYFHHFQMKSTHRRYDLVGDFDHFSTLFLKESVEYGSYWNMLKVRWLFSAYRTVSL